MRIFIIIAFALMLTLSVPAQEKPSLKDAASRGPYVSEKSSFTIALPPNPRTTTLYEVNSKPGSRGTQYRWLLAEGEVTVAHHIYQEPVLKNFQEIHEYTAKMKGRIQAQYDNARFVKDSQTGALGWSGPAFEFVAGGKLMFMQAFVRDNEELVVFAVAEPQVMASEPMMRTAVGSFQPTKGRATLGGTSYAMPPGVKNPMTLLSMHKDRVDENLKGMVKTVVLEREISGGKPYQKRRRYTERHYDSVGNVTKNIWYDDDNEPQSEFNYVNDYLANKRTSTLRVLYPGKAPLPADLNYLEYLYTHDDKGRTLEERAIGRDGNTEKRLEYKYEENTVTVSHYNDQGQKVLTEEMTLDEKGHVTKNVKVMSFGARPSAPITDVYKYGSFDPQGNWTKRTITGKDGEITTEWRTITYWK